MSDQPTSIVPTGPGGGGYGSYGGFGEPPVSDTSTRPNRRPLSWSAGTDLGLLVLRFAVGGVFFTHGAQKVFGLWDGVGIQGWTDMLRTLGYQQPELLAWPSAIAEMVAGAFVVLGAATPLAAAGLVGVILNALLVRWQGGIVVDGPGAELEIVLAGAAVALALTGAGRAALDNGRTWNRRPTPWGVLALIVGVVGALLVFFLLR